MKLNKLLDLASICRLSTVALTLEGCAGPHTPLGAIWSLNPTPVLADHAEEAQRQDDPLRPTPPVIQVSPNKQVLHGPSPVKLLIRDPVGDLKNFDLAVRYDGYDVSRSFLIQSKLRQFFKDSTLTIENPVIRLPASKEHIIEFSYRNSSGGTAYARFESPTCNAFRRTRVTNTAGFKPTPEMLQQIASAAEEEGFNPAFFTGLIAQESQFNPRTVSWAKAIGLTQVTSSAESEVVQRHEGWPRYPGIDEMSVDRVKILVRSGKINAANEWRLNSKMSIRGGATFIKLVTQRWSTEANQARIRALFSDPDTAMTQLILASYHSGYARVSAALDRRGKDWLKSYELKEARKYVNTIFSYCNHFVEGEPLYATAS